MTQPNLSDAVPVVVFGRDGQGKGHASRFGPADAALAERAAGLMGMRVLRLTTPEEVALAAELPAGRVFSSGRAFTPYVSRKRFDRLAAAPGAFVPEPPADAAAPAPGGPVGGLAVAGAPDPAGEAEGGPERPGMPPADWPGIGRGSLVLAAEEGVTRIWYAATVVADRGEDVFELRWLDDDDGALPPIVRRREHLGLFPPALTGALS